MHENLKKQNRVVLVWYQAATYTHVKTNKQTNKQRAKEGQRVTLNKWEQLSKELKCILR